jgi:unspecific monooxygenase
VENLRGSVRIQPILGDFSLLSLDGKQHLHHRKLLLPSFHGQRMEVYGELMATAAQKKISHWKKGDALKLEEEAREITFHVILKAIFGMNEENTRFEELTESLHALIRVMSKPFSFLTLLSPKLHRNFGVFTPWAKMMKLRHKVDMCLFEEIDARKNLI